MNHQFTTRLASIQLTEIKNRILVTLKLKHVDMQKYVRNKLIKVIIDIARLQWPHEYPTFMEDIMHVSYLT